MERIDVGLSFNSIGVQIGEVSYAGVKSSTEGRLEV